MGKLFWKFLAFLFLAQTTTLIVTGAFFWFNHQRELSINAGLEQTGVSRDLVQAAADTLKYGGKNSLYSLLTAWQTRPVPEVYAVDEKGNELLHRKIASSIVEAAKKVTYSDVDSKFVQRVELGNGHTFLLFVPDLGKGPGFGPPPDLQHDDNQMHPEHMARPPPDREPSILRPPLETILAGLIVSLLFAILIAWYFSKPISHLRNALMQAANGHLSIRIGDVMNSQRDELTDLGRYFDTMAGRLESLIQGQKRLLHHVSHELRSPLARIQIAIGLAKQSHEKVDSCLDRIQLDSDRMDALIGELLQLSKLESGTEAITREKVQLSNLLKNLVADASYEAEEHNISIKHFIQSDLIIFGDAELLYRAIENIVRNAIKYGGSGTEVIVSLFRNPDQKMVRLAVSDQGSGVPEIELDAIFQPFMRSSYAKSKDGYGVGLAMAKQIVEAHGGTIKANNLEPKGFKMQIELPIS